MESRLLIATVAAVAVAYAIDGVWQLLRHRRRREAPLWSESLLLVSYIVFILGLQTTGAMKAVLLVLWISGNALRFVSRRRNSALT